MIREMMIAFLAAMSHGLVDASDICVSRNKIVTCSQPPPKFTVPRPPWAPDPPCPAKFLVITGCTIPIICILAVFVLLPFVKNKCESALAIFINLCCAHHGLYISLLVSVIIDGSDVNGLFVDLFLLASACSYLVEAIAILFSVITDRSIPRKWVIILIACCWILPVMKCTITYGVDPQTYYYEKPDYFLANGREVAIVDVVLIVLIFVATVVLIILSICLLHRAPVCEDEKEAKRKKIRLRIKLFLLMFTPFYIWVFTLLWIGLICSLNFGIVFIIFAPANGIAILVAYIFRFHRSSCVKPENGEENAVPNSPDHADKKSSAF